MSCVIVEEFLGAFLMTEFDVGRFCCLLSCGLCFHPSFSGSGVFALDY